MTFKKIIAYQLSISHLGYITINKEIRFSVNSSNCNLQLNASNESLDEVIINYKYKPIKKK